MTKCKDCGKEIELYQSEFGQLVYIHKKTGKMLSGMHIAKPEDEGEDSKW